MNWLDISLIVVGVGALALGFRSGLVMQLTSLLALALGLFFVSKLTHILIPYAVNLLGVSEFWCSILAYIVCFISIMLVVYLLGKLVDGIFDIPILKPINKVGGMIFSFLKWMVLCAFILFFIVKMDVNRKVISEQVRNESHFLAYMLIVPGQIIEELKERK